MWYTVGHPSSVLKEKKRKRQRQSCWSLIVSRARLQRVQQVRRRKHMASPENTGVSSQSKHCQPIMPGDLFAQYFRDLKYLHFFWHVKLCVWGILFLLKSWKFVYIKEMGDAVSFLTNCLKSKAKWKEQNKRLRYHADTLLSLQIILSKEGSSCLPISFAKPPCFQMASKQRSECLPWCAKG